MELFEAVEGTDAEADVKRLTFERELDDPAGGVDDTASFLAHDPELGTDVVVQTVNVADDSEYSRFLADARLLQEVNNRHVRQVMSVGIGVDNRPYAVMEHIDRGSLRRRLESGIEPDRVDVDRLVEFLAEAMQALRESPLADHHVGVEDVVLQSVLPDSFPDGRLFAGDERFLLGERIANRQDSPATSTGELDLRVDRPPFRQVELPFDLRGASAIVGELVCGSAPAPDTSWLEHLRRLSRFPELNSAILNGLSDVGEQPESIEAWRQEMLSERRLADEDRDVAGLGAWFADLKAQTRPAHYAVAGLMGAIMTGVLLAGTGVVSDDEGSEDALESEVAGPETSDDLDTTAATASTIETSTTEEPSTSSSSTTTTEPSTSSLNAGATLTTTRATTRTTLRRTTSSRRTTTSAADSSSTTSDSSSSSSGGTGSNTTGAGSSTQSSTSPSSATSSSTTSTTEATSSTTTTTTTTAAVDGPLVVTGAAVESVTNNSARLTWDAVDGAKGFETRLNGNDGTLDVRAPGETSKDFGGLATGRNALLEVRAINDDLSKGPWVAVVAELLGTDAYGPNSASNPTLTVTDVSSTEITISWNNVSGNQGYDVYVWTEWEAGPPPNATSQRLTGLTPDTNYLIEVATKTGTGDRDRSERVPILVKTDP